MPLKWLLIGLYVAAAATSLILLIVANVSLRRFLKVLKQSSERDTLTVGECPQIKKYLKRIILSFVFFVAYFVLFWVISILQGFQIIPD